MNCWTIETVIWPDKNTCSFETNATGLSGAKKAAMNKVRQFVPHRKNLYLESKGSGSYTIVSDMDSIGEVKLKKIKNTGKNLQGQ